MKTSQLTKIAGLTLAALIMTSRAFCATPRVGTLSPSSGTSSPNATVTFATTFSDTDGWTNIQYVYFLISLSSATTTNCFYGYYNQNTNKFYLRNDAGTSWLGGYAPGSNSIIENSYVKLNCASSTATGLGSTMTVNWSVTFKAPFTGTKNLYLYVKDDSNYYQGYLNKGTRIITNQPPATGVVTPAAGTGLPDQAVTFCATYTDPDTWLNVQSAYLLMNTATSGANCLYAYYNQNANKLYLRNDGNTGWLGGYSPASANSIENSYVKLDCSKTTVSGSGNALTVNWNITFKTTFAGLKISYLYVSDDANTTNGWANKGDFCIFRPPIQPLE
jgi:hypothetical protein